MKKILTLCFILFVPLLMNAQIEFQVFHDTDQKDVFNTSDIRSLVLKDYILTVNRTGAESTTFAFTAIDSVWLDETGPVLSAFTTGTIYAGDDVTATSDKDGKIYLVPEATNKAVADLEAVVTNLQGGVVDVTANTPATANTAGLSAGNYVFYAVDNSNHISDVSAVLAIETPAAPVLSAVTSGALAPGGDVLATSDKDGKIYLVLEATNMAIADFDAAVSGSTGIGADATAATPVTMSTTGLAEGNYLVYAVDNYELISDASAVISISTVGVKLNAAEAVTIYPNPVYDMLNVSNAAQFEKITISNITGQKLILINNHETTPQINISELKQGLYFIQLSSGEQTITHKFIKK